jgi:hypothetical protein
MRNTSQKGGAFNPATAHWELLLGVPPGTLLATVQLLHERGMVASEAGFAQGFQAGVSASIALAQGSTRKRPRRSATPRRWAAWVVREIETDRSLMAVRKLLFSDGEADQ